MIIENEFNFFFNPGFVLFFYFSDVGDLWSLANAIHRFTDEHSELAEATELQSEKVTETVQPDERLDEINSEPESVGYIEPSQCQREKRSDGNVENSSVANSSANGRTCKGNDLQLSNSKQDSRRLEESNVQPETESFINTKKIRKRREQNYLQPGNASFIHASQADNIRKENHVWPENVSFVHSTQIIKGRENGEAESETPGFIDPTQISPIHKEVDFESETPGYRDPTQAVRQLVESNFDPATPGYRYPTQMSQRRNERYTNDETVGYIDPTPVNRSRRSSEPEPNIVPETEPPSIENWQDDMELEIADKDLFSPIPESCEDDTIAPETVEMEVSFCEGVLIPETLDVDPPIVSNAVASPRKFEEVTDGTLAKQRMRTLHRKTYPMSDYDSVGIVAESSSKSSTRLHRRLTDSALDSRTTNSIGHFDTLSVPDVRDPFMENPFESEDGSAHRSGRLESSSLNKHRNRLATNEAPSKHLRRIRDLRLDRKQDILPAENPRESLSSTESGDFIETERIKKAGREFGQVADNTAGIDRGRDTPMETVEMVEKTQPRLQTLMRDGFCDRGLVSVADAPDMGRAPEIEKRKPVKHLRRLSSWEIELRKRKLNNRDAMDVPLTHSDAEHKKSEPSMAHLTHTGEPQLVRPNEAPKNSRGRRDIAGLRESDTEPDETVEATSVNCLARIKDLAMDRMNKDSLSDRDTLLFANGGHLAETTDFETECIQFGDENSPIKRRSKIPAADNDKTKSAGVRESSVRNAENPEREPPRQLGRLTNWPLNRHNVESINDPDTVDVTDVGDLENEKNPKVRPLRQLKQPQNPKLGNHSMMPNDLHGVDITNIQDFDRERLLNEPPINDSDTADVDAVGDLLTESEKIPEARPLRQLKRLQTPKPVHHSIIPSDLRGVDITNIEDFAKDRATLTKDALTRGGNSSIRKPSKIPTNVRNSPVAAAAVSAKESSGQAPLKSVENLENLESQDKIPAKKAKAKIVQLKPRRRTIDKSTAVPKTIPKNVNKRNAKGETLLHTACVKVI